MDDLFIYAMHSNNAFYHNCMFVVNTVNISTLTTTLDRLWRYRTNNLTRHINGTSAHEMFNNTTARNVSSLWTKNAAGMEQAAVIDELIAEFSSSQMKFTETRSIMLIGLYVPLFLVAAIANSVVIVVVIKYHYMRR